MSTHLEQTSSVAHAPFGFVPLSSHIFRPPWAGAVSQDLPFRDGLNGVINLEITAETPIFVRGATNKQRFFEGPKGYALPGSSVRGAIRNVVEIASYGAMRRVNNHRYGVRDLQNQNLYVRHMAAIMPDLQGRNTPLPKVVAGWLVRTPGGDGAAVARIHPCHFAKVDYRLLLGLARKLKVANYNPGARQGAASKYRRWEAGTGEAYAASERFSVKAGVEKLRPRKKDWLDLDFGKVIGLDAGVAGRLVFTGQPSEWSEDSVPRRAGGHPKHHDFVFYPPPPQDLAAGEGLEVTAETFAGFEFVHSDGAQQHSIRSKGRIPNEEWGFWKPAFEKGIAVPVFFLPDGKGGVRAFGLAMMFRLAYDHSVHDAIANTQARPAATDGPDLADLIFGHVPLSRKGNGAELEPLLKGRVSFGLFSVKTNVAPLPPVSAILGTPKASYYPSYVEQQDDRPGAAPRSKDEYRTFMDKGVRIRGYKRYRVQPDVMQAAGTQLGRVNTEVGTTFQPLPKGTVFRGQLRIHNLRPAELGAILWALDFGGDDSCRHMLGMARSLGYGRVRFTIGNAALTRNDAAAPGQDLLAEAKASFAAEMERSCAAAKPAVPGGWLKSRAVQELLALARAVPAGSPHRTHMSIAQLGPAGRKVNQFIEAKKAASILPTALTDEQWSALAGVAYRASAPTAAAARPAAAPPGQRLTTPMPIAPPPRHGSWQPVKAGTVVKAELKERNKKGNWTCKLVPPDDQGQSTSGTIAGTAPADAAPGQTVAVEIKTGGNPRELVLAWRANA